MTTCIILHNMIIEDESDLDAPIEVGVEAPPPEVQTAENDNIYIRIISKLTSFFFAVWAGKQFFLVLARKHIFFV